MITGRVIISSTSCWFSDSCRISSSMVSGSRCFATERRCCKPARAIRSSSVMIPTTCISSFITGKALSWWLTIMLQAWATLSCGVILMAGELITSFTRRYPGSGLSPRWVYFRILTSSSVISPSRTIG